MLLPKYSSFSEYKVDDLCPQCFEPLQGKPVVAHSGLLGKKHPSHRSCAKEVASVIDFCPICFVKLDTSNLFTWKDRCIVELKLMGNDALYGIGFGLYMTALARGLAAKGVISAFTLGVIARSMPEAPGILGKGDKLLGSLRMCLASMSILTTYSTEGKGTELKSAIIGGGVGGIISRYVRKIAFR